MRAPKARPPFASIAVISAAALGYEVLLMRLLSIVHWHHFAYMIISVALLGYGASGTFLALAQNRLKGRFDSAYLVSATAFALTAYGGYLAAQAIPFNALELLWDPAQPGWLAAIYLLLFVPFFCAANCICLTLAEFSGRAHTTYAFDLVGAGVGAVGVILLLYRVEPMTALQVVAVLGLVAASMACFELRSGPTWLHLGLLATAGALLLTEPQVRMSQFKALSQALEVSGADAIDRRSSPLGLLTTVRNEQVPFRHAPGLSLNALSGPPAQLAVFTDGEALQAIDRFDGGPESSAYFGYLTSALPYAMLPQPQVLILGAGAGNDVRQALHLGAQAVDAVELDPQVIDLVENEFGAWSNRPYSDPRVRLHIGDARGFVLDTDKKYDLIQVAPMGGLVATSAGLQALGENYLLTVESFGAMLDVLRPGGLIALTRWVKLPPRDGLKNVAIAVSALEARGVERPAERLAMIRGWGTTTLVIGSRPISPDQIRALREFCQARSFDLVFYPGMSADEANRFNRLQEPWYHQGVTRILGPGREAFFRQYKFNVRPATDDRPYFSQFMKWQTLPEILRLKGRGGLPLLEQGYLILILTLAQSVVLSIALILLPMGRGREKETDTGRGRALIFFFLVGTAFMGIEIAFIQKFILLLHHPIFAVATVLGAFLVFAGLGSMLSGKLPRHAAIAWPIAGIALIVLVYLLTLPALFNVLMPLGQAARTLISVALIAPLALLMGMPFPLGLRRLATHAPSLVPWAWGINGCASVVSAIGATLTAIHGGFQAAAVAAVVLYILAALSFRIGPGVPR